MFNKFRRPKTKNVKPQAQPQPRGLEEITKDYQALTAALGQEEYKIFVASKESTALKERILNLNHEAGARKKLDAEAAAAQSTTAEVANEQA